MDNRKIEEQDKPDVEIHSGTSFEYLHAKKSGKVTVNFYSNYKGRKLHESYRKNLPEELQDGEVYRDGEIKMRTENSILEDADENSLS